jgi:molybdenum cofactor cytidylyltransferase
MISTIGGASPQLQIVVLAAGFSSRLGQSKALVRVRGVGLLRRTISVLAPLTRSNIIVVSPPRCGRYRVELHARRATVVVNRQRAQGLSSSVRCAVGHARGAAAVLLLPVDLVRLQRRDVARLMSLWRGARRRVIARRIGGCGGTPLILPRWMFRRALALAGDQGLRDFVRHLSREQLGLVRMPSAQTDVDTPQDLAGARRHRRLGAAPGHHQPG